MKRCVSNLSMAALFGAVLFLPTTSMFGQTGQGFPLIGQNGSTNQSGMSPYMKLDRPTAPENNAAFVEQHVSDTIRQNMAMEIELSQLALKHSRNAAIEKFAWQVIAENHVLDSEAVRTR
jgi:predicted outer membrane protein